MSEAEAGRRIGVSQSKINRWRNGLAIPDMNEMLALEKLFSAPRGYFIADWAESVAKLFTPRPAALRDVNDLRSDLDQWRERAKRAEKKLADLRNELRQALDRSNPSS